MGKVYVILADGFEEVEALTVVDILRRGGVDVTTLSVMKDKKVCGAHEICVEADEVISSSINIEETEMIILPGGGKGRDNMAACKPLLDALIQANERGKKIAAICAAPTVLGRIGLLKGIVSVCYPDPGLEAELKGRIAPSSDRRTITDGNITTSMGPATAMEFALELLEILKGEKMASLVAAGLLYKGQA